MGNGVVAGVTRQEERKLLFWLAHLSPLFRWEYSFLMQSVHPVVWLTGRRLVLIDFPENQKIEYHRHTLPF